MIHDLKVIWLMKNRKCLLTRAGILLAASLITLTSFYMRILHPAVLLVFLPVHPQEKNPFLFLTGYIICDGITERFGLEGTFKDHLVQPPRHGRGHHCAISLFKCSVLTVLLMEVESHYSNLQYSSFM